MILHGLPDVERSMKTGLVPDTSSVGLDCHFWRSCRNPYFKKRKQFLLASRGRGKRSEQDYVYVPPRNRQIHMHVVWSKGRTKNIVTHNGRDLLPRKWPFALAFLDNIIVFSHSPSALSAEVVEKCSPNPKV